MQVNGEVVLHVVLVMVMEMLVGVKVVVVEVWESGMRRCEDKICVSVRACALENEFDIFFSDYFCVSSHTEISCRILKEFDVLWL